MSLCQTFDAQLRLGEIARRNHVCTAKLQTTALASAHGSRRSVHADCIGIMRWCSDSTPRKDARRNCGFVLNLSGQNPTSFPGDRKSLMEMKSLSKSSLRL